MFLQRCLRRQNDSSVSFLIPAAHLGNADMIQPGLIPLQPNLDFMDTFEPFQGEDMGRERAWLLDLFAQDTVDSCFRFIEGTVRMGKGKMWNFSRTALFLVVAARSGKFFWDIVLSRKLSFSFSQS